MSPLLGFPISVWPSGLAKVGRIGPRIHYDQYAILLVAKVTSNKDEPSRVSLLEASDTVFLARPDGKDLYPEYVHAMMAFALAVLAKTPAQRRGRSDFEAFWEAYKAEMVQSGKGWENVPSPYEC